MKDRLNEEIVWGDDLSQINSPAFYDCIVHLICLTGNGSFVFNGNRFSLGKGDIAVISHPRKVSDMIADADFSCEFIAAPEQFLHNLLPANSYAIQGGVSLFDNPIIKVTREDAARFHRDISNIMERLPDIEHRFYEEMIGSLLRTMIYDLFDFHVKVNDSMLTTDRVGYIVAQFFSLIRAGKPKTEREVTDYANQLSVTPKYLSDTVKRITGISVSSHINRAAISIIKEYLENSRLSITQIADEMNFTSVSYFSRYCKKHTGISPAMYRLAGDKSGK